MKPCFPLPSVKRGSALICFYIIPAALQPFLLCLLIVSSNYVNWHPPLPSRICVNFCQSSTRSFFFFLDHHLSLLCFMQSLIMWDGHTATEETVIIISFSPASARTNLLPCIYASSSSSTSSSLSPIRSLPHTLQSAVSSHRWVSEPCLPH